MRDPKDPGDFFRGLGAQGPASTAIVIVGLLAAEAARIISSIPSAVWDNLPASERVIGESASKTLKETAANLQHVLSQNTPSSGSPRRGHGL